MGTSPIRSLIPPLSTQSCSICFQLPECSDSLFRAFLVVGRRLKTNCQHPYREPTYDLRVVHFNSNPHDTAGPPAGWCLSTSPAQSSEAIVLRKCWSVDREFPAAHIQGKLIRRCPQ